MSTDDNLKGNHAVFRQSTCIEFCQPNAADENSAAFGQFSKASNLRRRSDIVACIDRMSGRASKMSKSDTVSDGALTEPEMDRAAELLHRAVVHEQGNRLVMKISHHIHGRGTAVNAAGVIEEVKQAMSDASKRRLDSESEWDEVSNGSEFPILVPKSSEEKPRGSKPLAQHDLLPKGFGIPLPSGVASVADWGRTIIKMKKYKDLNLSYEELIKMAESNGEHHRYLQWIQSNFSPANEDIHKVKMTQAVNLALYLKKIDWQKGESMEFQRCFK